MKKNIFKWFMGLAFGMLLLSGCKDSLYDDYKAQAVDNHGNGQNLMVSTGVTSSAQDEFYVNAVDGIDEELEVTLIPVIISGANVSSRDIHVKFVANPDSLDAYNELNETDYPMAGSEGSPAFTLVDDGVVTIKAGTEVGYLKVKLVPSDYFGADSYAFSYKIESVQEAGYTISGNHNFGIVVVLPKNPFDGLYDLNIKTTGWAAFGILDDVAKDYGEVGLYTTGQYTNVFANIPFGGFLQAGFGDNGASTAFGATAPTFVFNEAGDVVLDIYNSEPPDSRNRSFSLNPDAEEGENVRNTETGDIVVNYLFHQTGRPDCVVIEKLTYVGPR